MSNTTPVTPSSNEEEVYANETIQPSNNKANNNRVMNIIEVSNIYPANLVKHPIHASQRQLIAKIRSEAYDVCRARLPYEYIRWAFNKFNNGFVYTIDNRISAFCIWKVYEDMHPGTLKITRKLHVYLVCGIEMDYKVVPRILDDLIHLCRTTHINRITLKAVNPRVEHYYIQNGFIHGKEFSGDNVLTLDVSQPRTSNPETRPPHGQTKRRARRHKLLV